MNGQTDSQTDRQTDNISAAIPRDVLSAESDKKL